MRNLGDQPRDVETAVVRHEGGERLEPGLTVAQSRGNDQTRRICSTLTFAPVATILSHASSVWRGGEGLGIRRTYAEG